MCTVTYLPLADGNFILTSNRDETPLRKTIPPKNYIENDVVLTYPKDAIAGGTWIGTSDKNRLVCLLNGGFENHKKKLPYKMSRGIITKNILSIDNALDYIKQSNFSNIEPFTLIYVDWNTCLETYELVWDGNQKYFSKLAQEPKIWSSSTLYTEEIKQLRKKWFDEWLLKNNTFSQKCILDFHKNEELGTPEISPKMKRNSVETLSITSIKKENELVEFVYIDFLKNETTKTLQKKLRKPRQRL
ncbi:NRDE family protein [Polaribacter sp. R77954]|uniref:NRDE family protein n=1 Tax=Polaribacter sp. R77954 TaxID=3093870 RepID=UPI0037C599EE